VTSSLDSKCPYLGIRPFQREDAHLFYGRETTINPLIDLLSEKHFAAVVAPSGYGKSSLIKAGLLPSVEMGNLDNYVNWCFADCRPGADPFANLAEQLLEDANFKALYARNTEKKGVRQLQPQLRQELCRSRHSLIDIVEKCLKNVDFKLFLLVDQFEEIFRFQSEESTQEIKQFVQLLLTSYEHSEIYVVLTMRLEFLGDCAKFDDLPEAINNNFFLMPRLTSEQLQEVIVEPAKQLGGIVDSSLLDKLLEEMRYHPERLPLLQHSLMRMWKSSTEKAANHSNPNIKLSMGEYVNTGGLQSLSHHADEIYDKLKKLVITRSDKTTEEMDAQKIVETVFRQLTEKRCDNQYIRCPCRLEDITTLEQVSEDILKQVIREFSELGHILRVDEADTNWLIDITHESLISQWQRLKEWADKEAERANMYRELEKKAVEWGKKREENDEESALLEGIELRRAQVLNDNDEDSMLLEGNELHRAQVWYETAPRAVWAKRYCLDKKRYKELFSLMEQFLSASQKKFKVAEATKQQIKLDSKEKDSKKQEELKSELTSSNDDKQCCWRWLGYLFAFRARSRFSTKKNRLEREEEK